jgi:Protein of unknown function (DUF2490)
MRRGAQARAFVRVHRVACTLVLIAITRAPAPVSAQTIEDGRTWWNVTLQGKTATTSPWFWYAEVQARTRDGVEALDQLLLRTAVGYDLTIHSSVWIGYAYTPMFPASGGVLTENRTWQQYLWNRPFAHARFASRSRLEERAIEGNDTLALRFRQQVRVTRPLSFERVSALLWDEIFVHLNSTRRTASGLDQNRAFGGVGITVNPATRVEVGYMNQYIDSLSGPNRSHHVLSGVLNIAF